MGLAFFEKRLHPLDKITRTKALGLINGLEFQRGRQVGCEAVIQSFLDFSQGYSRRAGEPRGDRVDRCVELFPRDDPVDHPQSIGFACANHISGRHQLKRARVTYRAWQEVSRAAIGHQSDLYEYLSEFCFFAGYQDVARESVVAA